MINKIRSIALLNMIFLAGCSIFSPVKMPPVDAYLINSVPHVPVKHTSNRTLLVTEPDATPLFNTTDMAYSTYTHQIAYFSHNRWAETPAKMLQSLMIQTLQNTHYYRAVVSPQFPGRYDIILSTQLLKLQQDFTRNPSLVTLSMRAQLVGATSNNVIATEEFTVVRAAPQNSPYGYVLAANSAAAELMRQLARFVLRR